MKFGYFFDGTEVLRKGLEKETDLREKVWLSVGIPVILITLCFVACGFACIHNLSNKITRNIIQLYETLEDMLS